MSYCTISDPGPSFGLALRALGKKQEFKYFIFLTHFYGVVASRKFHLLPDFFDLLSLSII